MSPHVQAQETISSQNIVLSAVLTVLGGFSTRWLHFWGMFRWKAKRWCPGNNSLANLSVSGGFANSFENSFGVLRHAETQEMISTQIVVCRTNLNLGGFWHAENVFEDCFGGRQQADPKETIYSLIQIYLLHGKKNSQENRFQKRFQKLPWASAYHCPPKHSSKMCSAGRKTSWHSQNRATNYDLRRNRLLGINVSRSKTCSARRITPRYSQNRASNYDCRHNRLLGMNVSRYTEIVIENVLSKLKNPLGTAEIALQTMICDEIVSWASTCRGAAK